MKLAEIGASIGIGIVVFDLMYAMLYCPDGISKEMFSFLVSVYLIGVTIAIIAAATRATDNKR
jgi:hypothetical protein